MINLIVHLCRVVHAHSTEQNQMIVDVTCYLLGKFVHSYVVHMHVCVVAYRISSRISKNQAITHLSFLC